MGLINVGSGAVVGQEVEVQAALTPGAGVVVDTSKAGIFTLTPGSAETLTASNITNDDHIRIAVTTSGTTSYALTFGSGFRSAGVLNTGTTSGALFVVTFFALNGVLVETGRTAAL